MKEQKVSDITDLLKKKLEASASNKKLLDIVNKKFNSYKKIDYSKMKTDEKIKTKLLEHGIMLNFDSLIEGNAVDLYKFEPTFGLKMSRIKRYIEDIEQVLGVSGVRILAPIPWSSLVGFEVPRKNRTFSNLPKNPKDFNLLVGVSTLGQEVKFDITEAPHVLVSGATGSGKSVCMNSFIRQLNSLPKVKAQIHLFDPKIVEFSQHKDEKNVVEYENNIESIHASLKSLIREMEWRKGELNKAGVSNIGDYKEKMPSKFVFIDEFGELILQNYVKEKTIDSGEVYLSGPRKGDKKTHKIKIHISKEIESYILRLSQQGRAFGIHLIIATQRPSVDIISGSIKANFPTKFAFRAAKEIDSKVVLDESGAEKLLGKGDCIFSSDEGNVRLQAYNI